MHFKASQQLIDITKPNISAKSNAVVQKSKLGKKASKKIFKERAKAARENRHKSSQVDNIPPKESPVKQGKSKVPQATSSEATLQSNAVQGFATKDQLNALKSARDSLREKRKYANALKDNLSLRFENIHKDASKFVASFPFI